MTTVRRTRRSPRHRRGSSSTSTGRSARSSNGRSSRSSRRERGRCCRVSSSGTAWSRPSPVGRGTSSKGSSMCVGVRLIGSYGLASGSVPADVISAVLAAADEVEGAWMETKGATIAVHYRATPDADAAGRVLRRASERARRPRADGARPGQVRRRARAGRPPAQGGSGRPDHPRRAAPRRPVRRGRPRRPPRVRGARSRARRRTARTRGEGRGPRSRDPGQL